MRQDHSTLMTEQRVYRSSLKAAKVAMGDYSILASKGPHAGESLRLNREVVQIGRGDWCDFALPDDLQVSKQHCELRLTAEGVIVRDLGSRNGVLLGPTRILEAYWSPEVPLELGETTFQLQSHGTQQEIELPYADASQQLVGRSPLMRKLFSMLERLGKRDIPILLLGETGTGKTSAARALHAQSQRSEGAFVEVNCGALSPSLSESLFFGHEKGAFTGADRVHRGFFEQADGGTLFLDEIGELPLELQPKLLHVLESGRCQRIGGEKEISFDVRILASTNRMLLDEVERGRFRSDLYYRLAVAELEVPPLRDRREDIPLLIRWLSKEWGGGQEILLTDRAMHKLQDYIWPGNVRELHNVLKRATVLLDPNAEELDDLYIDANALRLPTMTTSPSTDSLDSLDAADIPTASSEPSGPVSLDVDAFTSLKDLMDACEKQAVQSILEKSYWRVAKAAERLGISRVWLYKRMKKHGIEQPDL